MILKNYRFYQLNSGFTLVEIVIAIAIFALLTTLAVGTLNQTIKQYKVTQKTQKQLLKLERTLLQMNKDIMQLINRSNRDELGTQLPGVIVNNSDITITTGGEKNWTNALRSNLRHIRYELSGRNLVRHTWQILDPKVDTDSKEKIWLEAVDKFELKLYDDKHKRVAATEFNQADYLAIILVLEDLGEFSYFVPLPDA